MMNFKFMNTTSVYKYLAVNNIVKTFYACFIL